MASIQDLLNQEIDASLRDEANAKPFIPSGAHEAILDGYTVKQYSHKFTSAIEAGAEEYVRIGATVNNEEGKRMGRVWFNACPVSFESFGRLSMDSKLFGQLNAVVANDATTLAEVLDGIEAARVNIFGREFFEVPVEELAEEDQAEVLARNKTSKRVYLNADDDELRQHYMGLGLTTNFAVFNIQPSRLKSQDVEDDEIPF